MIHCFCYAGCYFQKGRGGVRIGTEITPVSSQSWGPERFSSEFEQKIVFGWGLKKKKRLQCIFFGQSSTDNGWAEWPENEAQGYGNYGWIIFKEPKLNQNKTYCFHLFWEIVVCMLCSQITRKIIRLGNLGVSPSKPRGDLSTQRLVEKVSLFTAAVSLHISEAYSQVSQHKAAALATLANGRSLGIPSLHI